LPETINDNVYTHHYGSTVENWTKCDDDSEGWIKNMLNKFKTPSWTMLNYLPYDVDVDVVK